MGSLTKKQVGEISKPGRYGDGNGLYLLIAPSGTKNWIQRVRLNGKRTDKGLGGVGKVSLADARKVATANLAAIQQGRDPWGKGAPSTASKELPPAGVPTFGEALQIVHDLNAAEWGEKTAVRWLKRMEIHAKKAFSNPKLGDQRVDQISRRDLADLLTPLRQEKYETARKVRQGLAKVFRWARANDYRTDDPADDALGELVAKVQHTPEHRPALHYSEVAAALHKVRFGYALRPVALAFEFLVLTAARTSEVRCVTWDEIDLDAGVWEIPAERMKARRSHKVPLSAQAVAILQSVRHIPNPAASPDDLYPYMEAAGLVFHMPQRQAPLSENAFLNRARKDDLGCVPHGFRSSFRDWAREHYGGTWEAIELSLAHAVGTSVSQAYFRTDLLAERRAMMQAWADYLLPLPF